jgi:cyclopropane fatty-acyl-phospholipid synthase-like methyltransferase
MTYSCAIFSRGARTLEEAQRTKLELVCRKLSPRPGARVLDVGCGWGSFALHAAREHGVHVTAITVSERQAALARERAVTAGLAERIEIRLADYREFARHEQFDAIASIGMVEHVGSINNDAYARQLAAVLRPGGRLLNQGIARLRHSDPEAGPVSERFVFPDAAPLHVSRVLVAIEAAGLEATHVEGFRLDYARTLQEWARNLDEHYEQPFSKPRRAAVRYSRQIRMALLAGERFGLHLGLPDRRPNSRTNGSEPKPRVMAAWRGDCLVATAPIPGRSVNECSGRAAAPRRPEPLRLVPPTRAQSPRSRPQHWAPAAVHRACQLADTKSVIRSPLRRVSRPLRGSQW